MATKTIKEWFDTLEEPYKTQAIHYAEGKENIPVDSLTSAIFYGFNWEMTEEGVEYWKDVYELPMFHVKQ